MKPLLEITSVPISIEYKSTPAQIERRNAKAEVEITRDNRGLSIKSRPIKLQLDSFEARNSITPTAMRSIEDMARSGRQSALTATATLAREGSMMVNIHIDQDMILKAAEERFNAPLQYDFNIKYLPDQPINMDWIPGELQIEYQMDKLNFDWDIHQHEFEFTPGCIEFTVAEHPRVVIEYVGGPIYVPPSASPDYKPVVDTKA